MPLCIGAEYCGASVLPTGARLVRTIWKAESFELDKKQTNWQTPGVRLLRVRGP